MNEIKVERISERYMLEKSIDDVITCCPIRIYVDIKDDKLTICPDNAYSKFEFRKSNPEMIRDIAELMLEAVKLINKKEK